MPVDREDGRMANCSQPAVWAQIRTKVGEKMKFDFN